MRDFFSQKYTFGEVSEILQTRHPCIRGYPVKSIFLRKKQKQGISFGISHLLQMMCKRTFTKFTFLSNRIYSYCENLRSLLAFWIFLIKLLSLKAFFKFRLNYLSTFKFQVRPTYCRKMMTSYLAEKHDVHLGIKGLEGY